MNSGTKLPYWTCNKWYITFDYTRYGPYDSEQLAQDAYDVLLDAWIKQRACSTGSCED